MYNILTHLHYVDTSSAILTASLKDNTFVAI